MKATDKSATKPLVTLAKAAAAAIALVGAMGQANASVIFTFTEVGGTVKMTSSGVLDTTKLVAVAPRVGTWGGTGIENNDTPGDIDIMGGTRFGQVDVSFGFRAGTDTSDITAPGGPFTKSDFSSASITGSRSFTTYSGFDGAWFRQAGIGVRASDIVGGLWTPDQTWTWGMGQTFASLGLVSGTYTVADALTGEAITIQVGTATIPEPGTLGLIGLALAGLAVARRRKS